MTSSEKPEEEGQAAPQGRSVTALSVRSFIVIGVISGFSFHLYLQCIKYMNDPSIAVKDTALRKALFPDVTYCYPTYFNFDRLIRFKYENRYNYLNDIFFKNLKSVWNIILFDTTNETSLSISQKTRYIAPALETMLPHMAMNEIGGGVQDNLIECRFHGESCDFLNFTSFWDGENGLCFQFTAQTNDTIPGGMRNGLSIMTHYKFAERVDVTEIQGNVKIYVHPRETYGTAEEVSGLGQVSKQLSMQYMYVYENKLSTAIIPCKQVETLVLCRIEVHKGLVCRPYKETDKVRQKVSLQLTLDSRCNCISYEWPIPEKLQNRTSCHYLPDLAYLNRGVQFFGSGNVTVLSTNTSAAPIDLWDVLNITEVRLRAQCYTDFKKDIARGIIVVNSERLCNPEKYQLDVLEENGPFFTPDNFKSEAAFFSVIKNKNLALLDKIKYYNLTETLYGRNVILLKFNLLAYFTEAFYAIAIIINVFPSMVAARILEEYFLYDLLYFIADMGGVTGLWVGVSIVTIFEIIEWLMWKVSNKCKKNQEPPEKDAE